MIAELFAGAGGWSTGLRMAGCSGPAIGIEWDMAACRTAKAAGHQRICADVELYPPSVFGDQVTGLIASPPCPTFSQAGDGAGKIDMPLVYERIRAFARREVPPEREWADVRSRLTAEPMRWAVALRPRWMALEQVPAVLPLWHHTAVTLRGLGYRAWCGILSAERYGVPQTRKRAILVASLDGPVGPPEPTHQAYRNGTEPIDMDDLFGNLLPPPVSMAQALGWNGAVQHMNRGAGMVERHGEHPDREMDHPSQTITAGSAGSGPRLSWIMRSNYGSGGDPADRGERLANEPSATVTGKIGRNMWLRNNTQDNACVRGPDEPAGTIFFDQRGNAVDWVLRNGSQENSTARGPTDPAATIFFGHDAARTSWVANGTETVRVTVQEAGILQSFPPDYPWQGTKTQQYRCVGDAVPPLLAAAILRPLLATTQERVA